MTSLHRDLRRMIAAAALSGVAAAVAACGSAAAPAATTTVTATARPPASSAPATPTPTPTPTQALPCPTSELVPSVGTGNGAAGSTYYPLDFTNISHTACTLFGYPGVSYVTGTGGSQIGRAASRNPEFSSTLVTLAPGGAAYSMLQVVDAMNYPNSACHLVTAHWLKIYPPNQTAPLYLSFTAPACSSRAKSVHILSVEAVRPGHGGTG